MFCATSVSPSVPKALVNHIRQNLSFRAQSCYVLASLFLVLSLASSSAVWSQSPAFLQGLAKLQQGSPDEAFAIWEPLSGAGDRDAQYGMALLYENGGATFPADVNKAVALYQQAANQGLREAQTNLGLLYAEGRGVPQDPGKAATLWQAAAKAGHDMAQFNLGLAYYAGNGVPQNLSEAVGLVYASAAAGLPEAQFAFGQFHKLGLGVAKSPPNALFWFERALGAGNQDAAALINELKGEGVVQAVQYDTSLAPQLPLALEGSPAAAFYGSTPPALDLAQGNSAPQTQQLNSGAAPQVAAVPSSSTQASTNNVVQPAAPAPALAPATGLNAQGLQPLDQGDAFSGFGGDTDLALGPLDDQGFGGGVDPFAASGDPFADTSDPFAAPAAGSGSLASDPFAAPSGSVAPSTGTGTQPLGPVVAAAPVPTQPAPTPQAFGGAVAKPVVLQPGQGQGIFYGAWLGTERSQQEVEKRWQALASRSPELFGQMEAGIEVDRIGKNRAYRLMAGPFPSKSIAWQVCNAAKSTNPTLFCKARKLQ